MVGILFLFNILFAVDWKNILDQFLSYVFFFSEFS